MGAAVRLFSVLVLSFALIACGKTEDEKAQDNAKKLAAEQNKLVGQLNSAGLPNANWSEADLKTYERKLNRLEKVERLLAKANGDNGVHIFGGNNKVFIEQRRRMIATARQNRQGAPAENESTGLNQHVETEEFDGFVLNLVIQLRLEQFEKKSLADAWTDEEVATHLKHADELLENLEAQAKALSNDVELARNQEIKARVEERRQDIERLR